MKHFILILSVFILHEPAYGLLSDYERVKYLTSPVLLASRTGSGQNPDNRSLTEGFGSISSFFSNFGRKDSVAELLRGINATRRFFDSSRNFIESIINGISGFTGVLPGGNITASAIRFAFRLLTGDFAFSAIEYGLYMVWRILPTTDHQKWDVVLENKRVQVRELKKPRAQPTIIDEQGIQLLDKMIQDFSK
ncbi:hypothetical protein HDE_13842 [Halotydeus destructor]|nr:hypothetical protein HDE_13842 [Halotydeus destructor]